MGHHNTNVLIYLLFFLAYYFVGKEAWGKAGMRAFVYLIEILLLLLFLLGVGVLLGHSFVTFTRPDLQMHSQQKLAS